MTKQTAVEWLEEICNDRGYYLISEYFQQAKEMEKEQMIDAYLTGLVHPLEMKPTKQAEQYYNKTYTNENRNAPNVR